MAIVSVAIIISFHLKSQPSDVERRFALPFGLVFWFLSLACLASGLANYIKTVTKYARRQALVQSGWKTQMVGTGPIVHPGREYSVNSEPPVGIHCCCLRHNRSLHPVPLNECHQQTKLSSNDG